MHFPNKHIVLIFICSFFIFGKLLESKQLQQFSIDGTWMPKELDLITSMVIKNGGVTMYNTGDTILNYRVRIDNNELILKDRNGQELRSQILYSKADTLILKNFMWKKDAQTFIKNSNPSK